MGLGSGLRLRPAQLVVDYPRLVAANTPSQASDNSRTFVRDFFHPAFPRHLPTPSSAERLRQKLSLVGKFLRPNLLSMWAQGNQRRSV